MIYVLYALSTLGVIFLIGLIWAAITYKKIQDLRKNPREFEDFAELMGFIRKVFECKIQNQVVMFGFVDSVFIDDVLQKTGLSDDPCLDVDVVLITRDGHEKVNTTCGNLYADLKKGDFVAVMPIHNSRHNLWYYTTIAKLKPTYLGVGKGFLIDEKYVD